MASSNRCACWHDTDGLIPGARLSNRRHSIVKHPLLAGHGQKENATYSARLDRMRSSSGPRTEARATTIGGDSPAGGGLGHTPKKGH